MNPTMVNPFRQDRDRHELWDIVIRRDIESLVARDWSAMKSAFIEEGFFGIDDRVLTGIGSWRLTFPNLDAYRREWLTQANDYARRFKTGLREALYQALTLSRIEIIGDTALVHRKLNGWLAGAKSRRFNVQRQTLYVCRKRKDRWRIASFTRYLPKVIVETHSRAAAPLKGVPASIWPYANSVADISALNALLTEVEQTRQSGMAIEDRQWLERACRLLGEQLATHVRYATLAAQLGVSYEVFRHRFRRLTGMSPHRYRQSRLVEQACKLLCTTRCTIAEIALELGFCDEFHFSHSFKKIIGQSPRSFRRRFPTTEV